MNTDNRAKTSTPPLDRGLLASGRSRSYDKRIYSDSLSQPTVLERNARSSTIQRELDSQTTCRGPITRRHNHDEGQTEVHTKHSSGS